jgi:hypothetical protein
MKLTIIVTGCIAFEKPLNVYGLIGKEQVKLRYQKQTDVAHWHCCRDVFNSKEKSTPGSVVLQFRPLVEGPTMMMSVVPPVPKPVASDMVRRILWPFAKGSCGIENVP